MELGVTRMGKFINTIRDLIKSKNFKYGYNALILTVIVVAIFVAIDIIAGLSPVRLDLTANKMFSISSDTKKILDGLKKDVTVYGLFDYGKVPAKEERREIGEVLDKYAEYSSHIKVKYVDPDLNPGFLASVDPESSTTAGDYQYIIKCGSKISRLAVTQFYELNTNSTTRQTYKTSQRIEQELTGSLKFVTSGKTPTIYFTTGHGEMSVDTDYKTIKDVLKRNNYEVKSINFAIEEKVPDDASTLVFAAPISDLADSEAQKVISYLGRGGKIAFLFGAIESTEGFKNFGNILSGYNITINNDKIKETDGTRYVPNRPYDIIPDIQDNAINNFLSAQSRGLVMPSSRSIGLLKNERDYLTVIPMIKSSATSIGEPVDITKKEVKGPLNLAVYAQYGSSDVISQILVVGNASFITDAVLQNYTINGLYFFLNALGAMQDRKDDVLIAPKAYDTQKMTMNLSQVKIVQALTIVVLPLIILGLGFVIWLRRRHL
jgi:hypothetical protein